MSEWTTRFTDGKGNPVSHEAFETYGFTNGIELEGQMIIQIKCRKGVLMMAARCETKEDFNNLGPLMYQQFIKENDKQ